MGIKVQITLECDGFSEHGNRTSCVAVDGEPATVQTLAEISHGHLDRVEEPGDWMVYNGKAMCPTCCKK